MLLYIVSIFLFTYREQYNEISNGIALVLIALIWTNILLKHDKIKFNNFLIYYLLFIVFSIISVFNAIDQNAALTRVRTAVLLFILMVSLVNYLDTQEKIRKIMECYVISGFITSVYIFIISDFSEITRFGYQISNVNTIGIILGFSSVFGLYFILEEKKIFLIPFLILNLVMILLTGSRKALIFAGFTILFLLFSKRKAKIGNTVKVLFIGFLIIFAGYYMIKNVPIFYQIIGIRMENLLSFITGGEAAERSVYTRYYMMQVGYDWFKERPLTGYGLNNYRFLFASVSEGRETYAHNNIIELLVGIGIFGTIFYYIAQLVVIKSIYNASKIISKTLCYSFLAITLGYLFMSVGMVYYYDKHITILMAVGSVFIRLSKIENKKLNAY